ncbi:MAG: trypsin-like serine protease [Bacteroidales bacterium]
MSDNIEYPGIFLANFINTRNVNISFTASLIQKEGYLLTVAHPFYSFFNENITIRCKNKSFCENGFEAQLVFKSDNPEIDFAILKIKSSLSETLVPFAISNIILKDNDEITGYGFGKAISNQANGKYDLNIKIGGKISAGLLFTGKEGVRHVTFGDSGAPMFLNNDFNAIVGINHQRDYTQLENQDYFSGYVLPVSRISAYLKEKNFNLFDFEELCSASKYTGSDLITLKSILEDIIRLEAEI